MTKKQEKRIIIGSRLAPDEKEASHYDVKHSECSNNEIDCVFIDQDEDGNSICSNCGGKSK